MKKGANYNFNVQTEQMQQFAGIYFGQADLQMQQIKWPVNIMWHPADRMEISE